MKKNLLFVLLVILSLSFMGSLFAQVPVTIGEGTSVNGTTGSPAPYGTWYKAFRQQYLVLATEFNNAGGGPGEITSVAFQVDDLNGTTPMTNFRVRMKHTSQTNLSSAFEAGDYQVLFQADTFIPEVGLNTHVFSQPFIWDGASNILIETVTDVCAGSYAYNPSSPYTATTFNSSLRFQSDSANGDTATTGTTLANRTNMVFMMEQLDMQDLVAMSVTGPNSPSLNSDATYTVRIKSLCPAPVSNYTVTLFKAPDTVIATQAGVSIAPMEELDFELTWTPTEEGAFQLFGNVSMTGDENPANDNTPMFNVTVMPEGLVEIAVGDGTLANTTTGPPTPYGTYWQNFREHYLVKASELNNAGGGPGEIYALSFEVANLNSVSAMPNYRIRMKHTTQQELTTTFEVGDYTQVFQSDSFMPINGWNLHPFSVPFDWDGASNILVEVVCDFVGGYTQNASVYYTGMNFASSLRYQSDSVPADTNPTGTLSNNRSNMVFNMQQLDMQDMVGLSIVGPTTPNVNSTIGYTVRVKNISPNTVTNYSVKLMEAPNTEIASLPGTAIGPMEELDFVLNWTPTVVGETQLFGRVVMPNDENPANDNTPMLTVNVMTEGLLVVELGTGTGVNGNTGSPAPYGTWYKAFREQFLFTADELFAAGAAPGLLNGVAFNVSSLDECTPMTNYRIRVKDTDQTALSSAFEAGDYEEVFQADSFMPVEGWNLHAFTTPYMWDGASNLLIDIVTDPIAGSYARNALTYMTNTGFNSSLRFNSDTASGTTGTTGTASMNRTNARFFLDIMDMGSISGNITSAGAPLADVTVVIENSAFNTITSADGSYSFPFAPTGAQTVTASKHGYADVSHNVTVVVDENTVQNFVMTQLPQVSVTGRIVGSDNPTVGLGDGTFSLSGYEPYSVETDASGNFTIPNVYANHVYNYNATALGYAVTVGTLDVGTSNINMGDIIVNEVAYPPHSVVANEAADFQSVALTWESPVPGGASFEDDFESYDDFATVFGDWVTHDVDGSPTYAFSGVSFPGSGSEMSFIIFNPTATTPPIDYEAHSGDKFAACFASTSAVNNDWMISPQVLGGGEVTFWAKTYMDYGLERFKVGVSTTGTEVADFTIITGPNYITAPLDWTEFTFDLSDYAGQQIYVGINCVSDDCFIFWVDDFYAGPSRAAQRLTTAKDAAMEVSNVSSHRGVQIPRAIVEATPANIVSKPLRQQERVMTGFNVYRLLAADQNNEAQWTALTTNPITVTAFDDANWGPLPAGVYKYAVKAVYTNNVLSAPAFSQELHKGMMGVLSGTVYELGTSLPIEGVTVTAGDYSGVTNASGQYSFSIYAGTYNVTAAKTGYESMTETGITIAPGANVELDFVLNEVTLPVAAVEAVEAGNNVNITWMEPGTAGGEWIFYCGENDDAIGTGGAADFDVAIRFPASALQDYVGMSLHAVKVWPQYSGSFSIRVWTGGTSAAPGTMVVDQPFNEVIEQYNMVLLDDPVTITGNEELWFGMRCNVPSGYPAGCDAGPAIEGFGNMMYFQNAWATLNDLAGLDYNWNIEGYVGYSAPDRTAEVALQKLDLQHHNESRALEGYKVWRLLQGQETNEAQWTALTPGAISATAFQDSGWGTLPDGYYRWAVKAEYTGGALSMPAFSNTLHRLTEVGTLAGYVRNLAGEAIAGATVSSGEYSATTNGQGAYSMMLPAGTHTVIASHPSYAASSQSGIIVVTGQITNLDFALELTSIVFFDDFESYDNFAVNFAPWTFHDIDGSTTYAFSGITFPGSGTAMSYIIFNPSATSPVLDFDAHSGDKMAACFASTSAVNNDWMITPQVPGGGTLSFWARTYMDYGLERLKVGVSTTGTEVADFTFIQGGNYLQVPLDWTEYVMDLGAYAGDMIHIAFNCVSDDCFILFVEDVQVEAAPSNEDNTAPVLVTELRSNYPNPFNPETTINFSVKENGPVSVSVYNVKGQLVRNLVNDVRSAGNHSVVWNGKDNNGRDVSSGVYYYKMNAGKYSSTKKMVLMK